MRGKILVIDDDPDILNVLRIVLEAHAFEVETVANVDGISNIIDKFNPNIILLDIMLGSADGRAVCADLKYNDKTRHLPVVLLSATTQSKADVLKWGADDFVAKPFEIEELVNTLNVHLQPQAE